MDWTVGTFWTVGNDAMDAGDWLRTAWTPGTDWGPVGLLGAPPSRRHLAAAARWGEDSLTHDALSHGLDRGDELDRGE